MTKTVIWSLLRFQMANSLVDWNLGNLTLHSMKLEIDLTMSNMKESKIRRIMKVMCQIMIKMNWLGKDWNGSGGVVMMTIAMKGCLVVDLLLLGSLALPHATSSSWSAKPTREWVRKITAILMSRLRTTMIRKAMILTSTSRPMSNTIQEPSRGALSTTRPLEVIQTLMIMSQQTCVWQSTS